MNWSTVLMWRGWALLVLCVFAIVVDTQGWNPWFALIPPLALPAAYAYIRQPDDEPPPQASQYYRLAAVFFVVMLVMQWIMERRLNPAYAIGIVSFMAGIGLITTGIRLRVKGE